MMVSIDMTARTNIHAITATAAKTQAVAVRAPMRKADKKRQ